MSHPLVVHGFETSNNFKVRVALGFKGIDYRFHTIDPGDRAELLAASNQPLTPVLTHADVTLFDSSAIMRYLEANFPATPQLFSHDYGVMRAIEKWENFGRSELHAPLLLMVMQKMRGEVDAAETERAAALFADATMKLEQRLADREWLAHTRMTAADIACGCVIHRVRAMQAFALPAPRPATYAWTERIMAYDRGPDEDSG